MYWPYATYRDMADYEPAFDASFEVVSETLRDAERLMAKSLGCLRARSMIGLDESTK